MDYPLLLLTVFGVFVQNLFKREFTLRTGGSLYMNALFNEVAAAAALLFLIGAQLFSGTGCTLHGPTLLYALVFAALFALETLTSLLALRYGRLALTSLILSCSLAVPTVWGLTFGREKLTLWAACGLGLLLASLILIRENGAKSADGRRSDTFKWGLCVAAAFFANGLCSVVQKLHQSAFPSLYRYELLESSMAFVLLFGLPVLFYTGRGRPRGPSPIRPLLATALPGGLANGAVNLFVVLLVTRLPSSLLFPLIAAGSIILSFIASKTLYRETLSRRQLIGFGCGLAAAVLLNL